jgi:DNA-binding NarL/FixJ family response regulator
MDQFSRLARSSDASAQSSSQAREAAHHESLSDKEARVLSLITEGLSNRQIAQAMSLAEGTIKNYVSRIMDKLHANTRTELAVMTRRRRRDS